jgi:UDP-N-acetylmuramoylalanine-D-glutamate ligase
LAGYGVTTLACLPVTGARLASATQATAPHIDVLALPDLESAMQALHQHRHKFDAVILSPGAPSYNQFKNFEERGRRFTELAEAIFGGEIG